MDAERFFSVGPTTPFRSHSVFSNRETERSEFRVRLTHHQEKFWRADHLQDFQRPAANIVVFHGDGGIGKSTLARQLLTEAAEGWPGLPRRRATAVLDFGDLSNLSFETALIRIRAALGGLADDWCAFDVALATYWTRKHPGESLGAFVEAVSDSATRSVGRSAMDQITAAVDQFLGGFGIAGLAYQGSTALGRAARQTLRLRALREEFPPFGLLMDERDPDVMLAYMPILLARDLERARARKGATAVCVLDTFESVQSLPPERGGLEDLMARLVYLVPNMFFVATSRRPLSWHTREREPCLVYGGEARWPGLAGGGATPPAQFHLGGLTMEDAEGYLRHCLTLGEDAAIPRRIRGRIIAGSGGSPHYLALSVRLFESSAISSGAVPESAFGHPFPQLLLRLMRDLSEVERDLLRAAALLESFDEEVLQAVIPRARGREIAGFIDRGFVRHSPEVWPPYRLHENVRRGVLECDAATTDGWTPGEWHRAAIRAVSRLDRAAREAWLGTSATRAAGRLIPAFLLTLHAARDHSILPPELGEMAYMVRELGHWQVLASLPDVDRATSPDLAQLVTVCRLTARTDVNAADRHAEMRRAVADDTTMYADLARYEHGHLAFFVGEVTEAQESFRRIRQDGGLVADGARLGLAGTHLRRSEFRAARRLAEDPARLPLDRARMNDLLGHVLLHNGRFGEAYQVFSAAHEDAYRVGSPLWAARASRHGLLCLMWCDPEGVLNKVTEARRLNRSVEEHVGLAQCDMAEGLAHVLQGDIGRGEVLLSRASQGFQAAGARYELLPIDIVTTLVHLAAGRRLRAAVEARRLSEAVRSGRPLGPPSWAAVAALWTTPEEADVFDHIDWLDRADARVRWRSVLDGLAVTR